MADVLCALLCGCLGPVDPDMAKDVMRTWRVCTLSPGFFLKEYLLHRHVLAFGHNFEVIS
jgi:hypothetical protein